MAGGDLLWGREGMEREEDGGKVSTRRLIEEGLPPIIIRRGSGDRRLGHSAEISKRA